MPPLDDATGISRRRFHKLALAGLGLPAASPAVAAGSQTRRVFDVLVVGGGVSGAYIAWRLMTGDPRPGGPLARLLGGPSRRRPRVGLLEASDRIGGRLYTVTQPEAPHLHAELGGMRFLETHESVGGLARHLGLDIVDFPMGGPSNRQHLRGVNFLRDDYEANPALVPHKLRASERGHQPWRLVVEAFLGAFPALAAMSPDEASEYLKTAEFDGRPLWEVGFWNFLIRQLSPEAFNLVCAASGYHTVVSNWNAYDAIVFIMEDFASPAYHRLAGGYQSLPLSLAQHFVEQGGVVHLDTRATSLVAGGRGDQSFRGGPGPAERDDVHRRARGPGSPPPVPRIAGSGQLHLHRPVPGRSHHRYPGAGRQGLSLVRPGVVDAPRTQLPSMALPVVTEMSA